MFQHNLLHKVIRDQSFVYFSDKTHGFNYHIHLIVDASKARFFELMVKREDNVNLIAE